MKHWWLATRPKTLTAGIVPILAATALAHLHGIPITWWVVTACLLSSVSIQIATNFINDAIDFSKGADTSDRLGPQRVTQSGMISAKKVYIGAFIFLTLALVLGIPLVMRGGLPIVAIGLVSLFLAYSYTGGPFPLAYLGLGDFFVILFFGLIAVGGVYFLLSGSYNISVAILGFQIGLLAAVLIAINNLRDVNQDRLANKKTIAVRCGVTFVRAEITILLMMPFLLQLFWFSQSQWLPALLPMILLPLAIKIARAVIKTEPSSAYNQFLAQSALLHSGFGVILSLGLLLA